MHSRPRQKTQEDFTTAMGRIVHPDSTRQVKERPMDRQLIQGAALAAREATSPLRHASPPSTSTKSNSLLEESKDSYYISDDYYSNKSGYDSDMFKKRWEDEF
jgi:hypothetical protein